MKDLIEIEKINDNLEYTCDICHEGNMKLPYRVRMGKPFGNYYNAYYCKDCLDKLYKEFSKYMLTFKLRDL